MNAPSLVSLAQEKARGEKMGETFLMVTLREIVSFILAAIGFILFAYPKNYAFLLTWVGGTESQIPLLGIALIVVAIYIFEKHPKFLECVIN